MYLLNEVLLCDITESNEGAGLMYYEGTKSGEAMPTPLRIVNQFSLHHNHESGP